MVREPSPPQLRRGRPSVSGAGVFMIAAGVIGLILGMLLVGSLTHDFRASLDVSRSAIGTIGETVEMIAEVNEGAGTALSSASTAADSAADSTRDAVVGLEDLAVFMEEDLPADLEAIRIALPGAIDAADAVDSTLGALSLIGVDYAPDEPFGESLRRIEQALDQLPEEVRNQGSSFGLLVPSARAMADDIEILATDLQELNSALLEVDELADSYTITVSEAEATVEDASSSLDRTVLFLRLIVVVAAMAAVVLGLALLDIDRRIAGLYEDARPGVPHAGSEVVLIDER
ncbi:MAG: hypothetical protein ACLFRT_12265 [Actinomycetota bacterium]